VKELDHKKHYNTVRGSQKHAETMYWTLEYMLGFLMKEQMEVILKFEPHDTYTMDDQM